MSFPLKSHGVEFRNWPGPGEEAAAAFGISHAVILPANARRVIIGGQVGIRDDGTIPSDPTEQIKEAFAHVEQALMAAGLGDNAMDFVYKVSPDCDLSTHSSCYVREEHFTDLRARFRWTCLRLK